MNNEKGITLLEVLAAMVILSLIILSASYLFTKNYEFSFREEKKDFSVNIARSVLEELKPVLQKDATAVTIFDQTINGADMTTLKDNVQSSLNIYSPSDSDRQYVVTISDIVVPDSQTFDVTDASSPQKKFTIRLNQLFSLIEVNVKNNQFQTNYTLQSYIEKKEFTP